MIRKISVLCCSLFLLGLISISCSDDEDAVEPKAFIGDVTLATQQDVNDFGAENYTRVTGSLTIGISQNRLSINSLAPLINLSSVGGILIVGHNDNLLNLEGLNNLTTIQGQGGSGTATERSVISGPMLRNLDALSSLKTINKSISISGDNINNINGLSNLEYIGTVLLISSTKITNLDPLQNLTHVTKLNLHGNTLLTNMDGLSNVNSAIDYLWIQENDRLDDFCGIRHIFQEYGRIDGTDYIVANNAYNPTQQNIIGGSCRL